MMPECYHAVFELAWSGKQEKDSKDNWRSELCVSHTEYIMFLQYFSPFVGHFEYFKMLNDAKVASLGFFI